MDFTTVAGLVHEVTEARVDKRWLNHQKRLSRLRLLIIDEMGLVPLSKTGGGTAPLGVQPTLREWLRITTALED